MTHLPIYVTAETHAKFHAVMDADNLGADTLISLGLEALDVADALSVHARELSVFAHMYRACREGANYGEVVA